MKTKNSIEIYYKSWCRFSMAALALLDDLGLAYEAIDVTSDRTRETEMIRRSGRTSVPEIFINGALIGGYDDFRSLVDTGAFGGRKAA
ncbi:MAG: glutaredoxin [Rhodospirillales bacterium]|nr:glutaredoxin [Alphaproteobacteria bacterium]MBL6948159.1 glutaredoxin [Rhodospirillales bacterium]